MKNLLFTLFVLLGLQTQAQTPCDPLQFYGVEEDFTLYAIPEVITITVSGNWEGESIVLADVADNVTNVYNSNPTNFEPYESLTICQSIAKQCVAKIMCGTVRHGLLKVEIMNLHGLAMIMLLAALN